MSFYDLTYIEQVEGMFSLAIVVISTLIGLKILHNGLKNENENLQRRGFITLGIFWILMVSPFYAAMFSFISYSLFNYLIPSVYYIMLAHFGMPWALLLWIYSYALFALKGDYDERKKKRKKLVVIYIGVVVTYLISFYALLFNPSTTTLVGYVEGKFNAHFGIFTVIFALIAFMSIFVTGTLFAQKSWKMEDPKIKWKGRLLLTAFILYTIGVLSDALIPVYHPLLTILFRGMVILSGFIFYLSFFLPDRIANILIKK